MENLRILVSTCDKYQHLMPGFAYLFNKYMPGYHVDVVSDSPRRVEIPSNFSWNTSPHKDWGAIMLGATEGIPPEMMVPILFLFDDYWLRSPVDRDAVKAMLSLLGEGVHKADLSHNTEHFPHTLWKTGLIVATQDSPYRSSTQPAIWNIHYLRSLLRPSFNPWQFELSGLDSRDGGIIVGKPGLPAIYDYANVYYKGGRDGAMFATLPPEDREALLSLGHWRAE